MFNRAWDALTGRVPTYTDFQPSLGRANRARTNLYRFSPKLGTCCPSAFQLIPIFNRAWDALTERVPNYTDFQPSLGRANRAHTILNQFSTKLGTREPSAYQLKPIFTQAWNVLPERIPTYTDFQPSLGRANRARTNLY